MAEQLSDRRITTRDRLLDVACCLMGKHGFHATSIDDIIKEAKVSKGNFFHYFGSKEELGYAVIESYRQHWAEIIERVINKPGKTPMQRLTFCFDSLVEHFRAKETPGCPCGMLAQELSERHDGFRLKLAEIFEMMSDGWHRLLEDAKGVGELHPDVDTRGLAEFIVADMQGAFLLMKTMRNVDKLERHFAHTREYLTSLRAT